MLLDEISLVHKSGDHNSLIINYNVANVVHRKFRRHLNVFFYLLLNP